MGIKTAKENLQKIRTELNRAFPERKALIDGALTALIAGEHVLALGPPGTGKSLFSRTIADTVAGGSYFELLLTKFTTMEEVFGPISFNELKQDRYKRLVDGHAADAQIVFLDEIWKASSSILNALLTLMQERVIHNGGKPQKAPLEMIVAASNEYPQDESLAALYDRFAIKFWVDYIADADSLAGLLERGGIEAMQTTFEDDDLDVLRKITCSVVISKGQVQTLIAIKDAVEAEGFVASDRTWIKAVKMIKARAVLNGRIAIHSSDYMVLADMLWKEHKDRAQLQTVIGNAADPYGSRAEAIVDAVKAAIRELPSMSLLTSGQKTKIEMINAVASVSGKVVEHRDKILDVAQEAGGGHSTIEDAKIVCDEAMKQVDSLMLEVTSHRG